MKAPPARKGENQMTRTYKLIADTTNGIMMDNSFDGYDGIEIMSEENFTERLSSLGEDELIGAEVSEETYLRLDEEYGVRE